MQKQELIYGIETLTFAQEKKIFGAESLGKKVDPKNVYEKITEKVIELMESSDDLP